MSIFDVEDNIEKEENIIPPYSRLKCMQYYFTCTNDIDEGGSEFKLYCKVASKADSFYRPFIPGLPCPYVIRQYLKVVFSGQRPKNLKFKNEDWFKGFDDKKLELLLGEYRRTDRKYGECIILYVNNIANVSNRDINSDEFKGLLLATYLHELYHAYFRSDKGRYIPKIEEPLAEFGALYWLDAMACMGVVNQDSVAKYRNRVASKKNCLPIYAFGEFLYQFHDKQKSWKMGHLIDFYKLMINLNDDVCRIDIHSWDVQKWDQAYKDLCKALNYVD